MAGAEGVSGRVGIDFDRLRRIFDDRLGFGLHFFGLGYAGFLFDCILLIPHGLDEFEVAEGGGEVTAEIIHIAHEEAETSVFLGCMTENLGDAREIVGFGEFFVGQCVMPGLSIFEEAGLHGLGADELPAVEG